MIIDQGDAPLRQNRKGKKRKGRKQKEIQENNDAFSNRYCH